MNARWFGILTVGASVLLGAGPARAYDTGGPPLEAEAEAESESSSGKEMQETRSSGQIPEGQQVRASYGMEEGKKTSEGEGPQFTDQG